MICSCASRSADDPPSTGSADRRAFWSRTLMNEWIGIGIGILLTIGTGLFVAAEFSLVNLDRRELEARKERGETGLDRVITAVKITSTHLSSAQLGITLTTLLAGYTFEPAISSLLLEIH